MEDRQDIYDIARHIKESFEDIEQYNINLVLYCDECSYADKFDTLKEVKDKLVLLLEEIDKSI